MAAKGISSGIEAQQRLNQTKELSQYSKQWNDFRNKVDSILMVNNVIKSNDLRQLCLALDHMTTEERIVHINNNWGPLYVERVRPLLQQLETLEQHIARQTPA